MAENSQAVQMVGRVLVLGAVVDFALAIMFSCTNIVDLGDPFVTDVVAGSLLFAGVMTLAVRPFLLRRMQSQNEGRRRG